MKQTDHHMNSHAKLRFSSMGCAIPSVDVISLCAKLAT